MFGGWWRPRVACRKLRCAPQVAPPTARARCPCPFLLAVWISGLVQTGIYCDFFYYYIKSWQNNTRLALPA